MFVKDCESVVTSRKSGFSLVEVLAALMAASILALTAGIMLFHAYDAWTENHDAVNLQRDGRNAMDLITRAIRNVASSNVVAAVNNNLVLSNVVLNNQGVANTVQFRRIGRNLIYDPDMNTGGDSVLLIDDGVFRFNIDTTPPTPPPGTIRIILRLARGNETIRFDTITRFRN